MGLGGHAADDSSLKTLKIVLNLVIHRVFLSEFTWTGKTKPGNPRKRSIRDRTKLQELFIKIVSKNYSNYDYAILEHHLKNKILKGAYE